MKVCKDCGAEFRDLGEGHKCYRSGVNEFYMSHYEETKQCVCDFQVPVSKSTCPACGRDMYWCP